MNRWAFYPDKRTAASSKEEIWQRAPGKPGTLNIDLDIMEFCHLLKGHWILTSESGQVTEIRAGDSWVFPRGWKGTGEVVETVRKVYLVVS